MNGTASELRARNLRTLAALAALFLLPLVIAFFTYYGTGWRPAGRVNHGVLITPARPLPLLALPRLSLGRAAGAPQPSGAAPAHGTRLRGKWSLVYVGSGACGSSRTAPPRSLR